MTCSTLHLTNTDYVDGCRAIVQGSDYAILDLYVEGDYSGHTPSGQIRNKPADASDSIVLATFAFLPLVFGVFTIPTTPPVTGGFTKVSPRLSAAVTQVIPSPPKTRTDIDDLVKIGRNVWVYDIELALGAVVLPKLAAGWVEVTQEVTRL